MNLRGLTLIEVLAATALLTLVAGSGLTLVRQAAQARRTADLTNRASEVIRAWMSEFPDVSSDELPVGATDSEMQSWQVRDENGGVWRARVETARLVTDAAATADAAAAPDEHSVQCFLVTLEWSAPGSTRFVPVTTLVRACPGDPRQGGPRP